MGKQLDAMILRLFDKAVSTGENGKTHNVITGGRR
jgi:hypothetical protein